MTSTKIIFLTPAHPIPTIRKNEHPIYYLKTIESSNMLQI